MINSIGSAWQTHLDSGFPPTDRVYADFRLQEYPDLETGSAVYTLAREDNLIDRGNCESATAPMMLGETVAHLVDCTSARSSDYAHGGEYSYKITKAIAAGSVATAYITDNINTTDLHGVVPGETYKHSVWVYVPSASGIDPSEITIQFYYYTGGAWSSLDENPTTTDTWEEISVSRSMAAAASGFTIGYEFAAAAALNEYFYIDDLRLTTHTVPGSHYLSSGYIETLCPMTETLTLQIKFKPTFAFDTGTNQHICGWYVGTNQYLYVTYAQGGDVFQVLWKDGGAVRTLTSAQYDNGTAFRNVNQWITLTAAIDLSTGTTAGSALWMDKTQDDTSWSGNIDAKSTEFNKLTLRRFTATGAFDIAHVRYWPNRILTDAEVQNDAKDVADEEIFFSLDGHGTGRTRCNITRFVRSITTTKNVENPANGAQGANRVSLSLNNTAGEFSDDQYAAFAPESDQFNGTIDQKYLQRRSNITIENWYAGDFDTIFFGKLTSGKYQRQTPNDKFGVVYCSAEDMVGVIARQSVRRGRYWEDADLVDTADETDSLLHLITRLATKKEVYNYLPDASFDSTAPDNSWAESSPDVVIARSTSYSLFGSNSGQITYTAPGTVAATVTFTGKRKLLTGETWTFYGWLQSTAAASDTDNRVYISESDTDGSNALTAEEYTFVGGEGFKKFIVSHTISSSGSDRLVCYLSGSTGDIIRVDGVHLTLSDTGLNYFVPSTAEGTAGVYSATDAADDSYDTIGFDAQDVAIVHPWRRVEANESLWEYCKDLGNATVASYIGLNSAGTFRYRSRLSSDYSDPVPMGTIDDPQGIAVELEQTDANRVIVHGVNITKSGGSQGIVWDASASNVFAASTALGLNQSVTTGATWPSTATYGDEFVAKYGESGEDRPVDQVEDVDTYFKGPHEFSGEYQGGTNAIEGFINWLTGN